MVSQRESRRSAAAKSRQSLTDATSSKSSSSSSSSSSSQSTSTQRVYAVKFFREIVDRAIAEVDRESPTRNNPKTVKKWLEKMKSSLLRKVLTCSRALFAPEDGLSMERVQKEISETKISIGNQLAAIKDMGAKFLPDFDAQITETSPHEDVTSALAEKFQTVKAKLQLVGLEISKLRVELPKRIEAMKTNMEVFEEKVVPRLAPPVLTTSPGEDIQSHPSSAVQRFLQKRP